MPGAVIGKRLNLGYEGNISRSVDAITTPMLTKGEVPFGRPVAINEDGTVSLFGAESDVVDFVGISVREVKEAIDYGTSASGYLDKERIDVMNRGYMTVKINNGTPKVNGKVFIRIKENVAIPKGIVGGFEAEADGLNTVELPGVRFMSSNVDANKIAEITILSRAM